MRRVFEQCLAGVFAAALLAAAPGCLLVGYSADDGGLATQEPDQRRIGGVDAGLLVAPADAGRPVAPAEAGLLVAPADAGHTADAGGDATIELKGCGLLQQCLPVCTSGSCRVDCANSELCWTTCDPNTSCTIDCSNGGICDMDCAAGASCDVDCRNTRDCDHLECEKGASCVLRCGNNLLGCSLSCNGVAMTCANNVHVCDAPCPAVAAQ